MKDQTSQLDIADNKMGIIQITRIWLTPVLAEKLMAHNEVNYEYSIVKLKQDPDGSYRIMLNTLDRQLASRALMFWLIPFMEKNIKTK